MLELDFARSLAKEAGKLMSNLFTSVDSSIKTDGSIATRADKQINRLVIDSVKKSFPSHAVLGEEESYFPTQSLGTWVCDPIDGTLPYSLNIPTYVFSLALLDTGGEPIVSTVYDPSSEGMYWATKGNGAFKDGLQLKVNSTSSLHEALIGNSGRSSKIIDGLRFKTHIYSHCYRPIILHSVIYEAMLVASGKIAAAVLTGSGAHDAASAKLIVEEAGGKVTNLFGEQQRYDRSIGGAIISNGAIHSEVVSIAQRYRIEKP